MIRVCVMVGLLFSAWTPAGACGPIFPTMYAVFDLSGTVLTMPRGSFAYELHRLTGQRAIRKHTRQSTTIERDAEELCDALEKAGVDGAAAAAAADAFQLVRSAKILPATERSPALQAVPPEFLLYAEGAFHYHHRHWAEALAAWERLLALPAEERPYRSTWAAYMCGKVYLGLMGESAENWSGPAASPGEGEAAIPWFERTRKLAASGFADSLNLACESLGDQARVAFLNKDYLVALQGYLAQYRAQPEHSVQQSLLMTAARMLNQPADRLAAYAADAEAAPVLTAYLVTRKTPSPLGDAWMAAVAGAGMATAPPHANRLAWLAYNKGDMELARRLMAADTQPDPMARWLQAKLALWDGDTDRAIALLESLAVLEANQRSRWGSGLLGAWWTGTFNRPFVDGELGLLYLARKEYGKALDSFLRGGLWNDAAYVAEQVLTAEELDTYLTRRKERGDRAGPIGSQWGYWYGRRAPEDLDERLAYLLARRWMRLGNRARALAWYPASCQSDASELHRWLSEAEDVNRHAEERAVARIKAARIVRDRGMELLGTELDPDWKTFGGSFNLGTAAHDRLQPDARAAHPKDQLTASTDERNRTQHRDIANSRRFHYRKLASDMMWEAAQALPDNDMRTAEALYYGGVFIKGKDPQGADRFYKALVNRCRELPIGDEADQRRWFPPDFPAR